MPNSDMTEQQMNQHAFIARGLTARDRAQKTGRYISSDQVMAELELMLKQAQQKTKTTLESRPR